MIQHDQTTSTTNAKGMSLARKHKKKDHEKILEEIIVENYPKMGKEIITQVQETQRVPNKINPRRNTQDTYQSN